MRTRSSWRGGGGGEYLSACVCVLSRVSVEHIWGAPEPVLRQVRRAAEHCRVEATAQQVGQQTHQNTPILKSFPVGPNSLFTLLKEQLRCNLKCFKNRLQKHVFKTF